MHAQQRGQHGGARRLPARSLSRGQAVLPEQARRSATGEHHQRLRRHSAARGLQEQSLGGGGARDLLHTQFQHGHVRLRAVVRDAKQLPASAHRLRGGRGAEAKDLCHARSAHEGAHV